MRLVFFTELFDTEPGRQKEERINTARIIRRYHFINKVYRMKLNRIEVISHDEI